MLETLTLLMGSGIVRGVGGGDFSVNSGGSPTDSNWKGQLSTNDQPYPGGHLSSRSRHSQFDLDRISNNPVQISHQITKTFAPQPHHHQPPNFLRVPRSKIKDHRRKKHRGKKKSRVRQMHAPISESSSASSALRSQQQLKGTRPSFAPTSSDSIAQHSKTFSDKSMSRTQTDSSSPSASKRKQRPSRKQDQLFNDRDSKSNMLKRGEDYYKKERSKVTMNLLQRKKASSYRYDPFDNPPADRYDLVTLRERPPPETTTALPHFVPDGNSPVIPDPSFLPGTHKVVAHEGGVAILPCAVKYLEMKEVRK
ncbi:hypothetical protein PoB_006345100 [Plakobranchus ocellatus]|uniref:Uncharacterized protein n=1 Tax=Plakobranchus ocellatus TaxID=259542 RepID=A0AAV4CYY8_9GAST|nr:hypothetical protein PoB_006345100 [Plakobranchus ocellatus]